MYFINILSIWTFVNFTNNKRRIIPNTHGGHSLKKKKSRGGGEEINSRIRDLVLLLAGTTGGWACCDLSFLSGVRMNVPNAAEQADGCAGFSVCTTSCGLGVSHPPGRLAAT